MLANKFPLLHNAGMKLESDGIIISIRPFGERDVVARIFTSNYGVLSGLLRGAGVATKNKPMVGFFKETSLRQRGQQKHGVR